MAITSGLNMKNRQKELMNPAFILIYFRIGHDNAGGAAAWYLDHVEIDCPTQDKKLIFPCERWLDKNKDDGLIEMELYPKNLSRIKKQKKEIQKVDKTVVMAMTKKSAIIDKYAWDVEENDDLEQSNVNTLESSMHSDADRKSDNLDPTETVVETRMALVEKTNELREENMEIVIPTKQMYNVFVYTGNKWGAGTDANVYLIMYGEQGETEKIFLKNSKTNRNKFERNACDEFEIENVDIGEPQKIR